MPHFTHKTQIRLHDTDAAGLLFFANQFKIVHDAYEHLLEKWGFGFETMLKTRPYFLPIVHAEADYKAALFVGDRITVKVAIGEIGTTSFSFTYTLHNAQKLLVGTAKTVHVTVDKKTKKKMPLPQEVRKKLENFAQ